MSEFGSIRLAEDETSYIEGIENMPRQEVAPEELFSAERIAVSHNQPAPKEASLYAVEAAESRTKPYMLMQPGPTTVPHEPVKAYRYQDDPGAPLGVISYKYDTREAYEDTRSRGQNRQTMLASFVNYRAETAGREDDMRETLHIDRELNAFVRREKAMPDGTLAVATLPASWEDMMALADRLDGRDRPLPPLPEITATQAEYLEAARQNTTRFKDILSVMPEFRRAVVDKLSDVMYFEDIPQEVGDKYVAEFWAGKLIDERDTRANDLEDNYSSVGKPRSSRLEFRRGSQNIRLSYRRTLELTEEGEIAVPVVSDVLDLVIQDNTDTPWRELYVSTEVEPFDEYVKAITRSADGRRTEIPIKERPNELKDHIEQIATLLELPAEGEPYVEIGSDIDYQYEQLTAGYTDVEIEPPQNALEQAIFNDEISPEIDDSSDESLREIADLQWPTVHYPGADTVHVNVDEIAQADFIRETTGIAPTSPSIETVELSAKGGRRMTGLLGTLRNQLQRKPVR